MIKKDTGPHLEKNSQKVEEVTDVEWCIAIKKCREHIRLRIKNRTKFGAHTVENLGIPAIDYYLEYAYSSILDGFWEWKDNYNLTDQMIRIIESRISTVVEKYRNAKNRNEIREAEGKYALNITVKTRDIEHDFYNLRSPDEVDEDELQHIQKEYDRVEKFVNESEVSIKEFWGLVKEGYKRSEIAEILELTPKQLDKLKEKFLRKIKKEIGDEQSR